MIIDNGQWVLIFVIRFFSYDIRQHLSTKNKQIYFVLLSTYAIFVLPNRFIFEYMKFYLQLFWSFFKIGAFTIGGGYAMIPLIEQEVVGRRHWISPDEFSDTLTLAQSAPGPVSINSAVFVGYKLRGMTGVLTTVLGTVIPSFVVILVIAIFFSNIKDNQVIERIFGGLRPAVVALIVVPVVNMLKNKGFAWNIVLIAIAAAVAVAWLKISPVLVIIVAGTGGIVYSLITKKHD